MGVLATLYQKIRQVVGRLIPYRDIQSAERVQSPLSTAAVNSLDLWYRAYLGHPPWLKKGEIYSMGLPAFISSELARQITLEMSCVVSAPDGGSSARADYLAAEVPRLFGPVREKLELGLAAGGLLIKPYVNQQDQRIYLDFVPDWAIYPIAFDDEGRLSDVVIPDTFQEGGTTYTRLERYTLEGSDTRITQRAFKSSTADSIGREVPLTSVPRWSQLEPEVLVQNSGPLFGWYRVAGANTADPESPLGPSCFAKAIPLIEQADKQYSRLLWEYEAAEMRLDVDDMLLKPMKTADGSFLPEYATLERLARRFELSGNSQDSISYYAPTLRDASYLEGLNQLLMRVEDQCGLSRGTLSDANVSAKTATELKIMRQRSYATVHDNQQALERCLRDVLHAVDRYTTLYHLAPEGPYEASFSWDDSVITDRDTEAQEYITLLTAGVISKSEFRQWYFGETPEQAQAGIDAVKAEESFDLDSLGVIGQAFGEA